MSILEGRKFFIIRDPDSLEEVGFVKFGGFELNIPKMKVGKKHLFKYDDSDYMAVKNEDGNVVLSEIIFEDD